VSRANRVAIVLTVPVTAVAPAMIAVEIVVRVATVVIVARAAKAAIVVPAASVKKAATLTICPPSSRATIDPSRLTGI
jgi:hypothetical protein